MQKYTEQGIGNIGIKALKKGEDAENKIIKLIKENTRFRIIKSIGGQLKGHKGGDVDICLLNEVNQLGLIQIKAHPKNGKKYINKGIGVIDNIMNGSDDDILYLTYLAFYFSMMNISHGERLYFIEKNKKNRTENNRAKNDRNH